ncbi:TonB system transport protein ExbD [Lichenibacterium dinghuense]|uniref:TonB system transport protein ExbD n=1 Tax=Lichenibacterium dinghuense TaxID=2895977 RepID=UPI001F00DA78|nr:TonB system transport protein ExbD [Lichenibacterium sp. 6Y81]
MAVKLNSGEGDDLAPLADINVTPFIDVALVLLIIFMVAAPLSTVDTPVDLPISNAASQPRPKDPVFLSIGRDLSLKLGEAEVARGALADALDRATSGDHDARILLRADRAIPYGDLMGVMNALRRAGYLQIALVGLDLGDAPATP